MTYGKAPEVVGYYPLPEWSEYMHFMYLPIAMPEGDGVRVPERLQVLRPILLAAFANEAVNYDPQRFTHVYISARRGYAVPGDPLNRPGWHADGFGTDDVNYIWTDAYPTEFALQDFENISDDHVESIDQFEEQAGTPTIHQNETLLRLDPYVVHRAPTIPPPGGERSFVKISFSTSRYNLRGNSHNFLFDYDWKMWDRAALRNDPAFAGGDSGPQS